MIRNQQLRLLYYFFKLMFTGEGECPFVSCQPGLVHLLEHRIYLFDKSWVNQLLHAVEARQPFVEAKFERLFVPGVLEFEADPVVHFKYRDFKMRVVNVADDAHECNDK